MRAKTGEILAEIGEETINSTSRENLDFARIFSDLEQVHRPVWELLLSGRPEVRILLATYKNRNCDTTGITITVFILSLYI